MPNERLTSGARSYERGMALGPERAFVVQFHATAPAGRTRLRGRVEHVVSGEVAQFRSTAELLDFVVRALTLAGRPEGSSAEEEGRG